MGEKILGSAREGLCLETLCWCRKKGKDMGATGLEAWQLSSRKITKRSTEKKFEKSQKSRRSFRMEKGGSRGAEGVDKGKWRIHQGGIQGGGEGNVSNMQWASMQ